MNVHKTFNLHPVSTGEDTARFFVPIKVSFKRGVRKDFVKCRGKYLCQSLFFNKSAGIRPSNLLKKETVAKVFSYEFCKTFRDDFFSELVWTTSVKFFINFYLIFIKKFLKIPQL